MSGAHGSFFDPPSVKRTVDDGTPQGNPEWQPHLHEPNSCLLIDLPVESGIEGRKDSMHWCTTTASLVGDEGNFCPDINGGPPGFDELELDARTKGERVLELAVAQSANDGVQVVPVPLGVEVATIGSAAIVLIEPTMDVAARVASMGIDNRLYASHTGVPRTGGIASGSTLGGGVFHGHDCSGLCFPMRDAEAESQSFSSGLLDTQQSSKDEPCYEEETEETHGDHPFRRTKVPGLVLEWNTRRLEICCQEDISSTI